MKEAHMTDLAEGVATPTLARLVRERKEATGKSYREMAAESGVSIATFHKMAQGRMTQVPAPRIAEGVAQALGVDVTAIYNAVGHDLGVREFHLDDVERTTVYLGMADLPAHRRRLLLDLMNDMRERSGLPPVPPVTGPIEVPPLPAADNDTNG